MMNGLLRILLLPGRLRYRWQNRNRQRVSQGTIDLLKLRVEEARHCGSENLDAVYNVALYLALLERDLSAYSRTLFFSNTSWERQFAARGMAVLLYEGSEDITELLGRDYRKRLKHLGLGEPWFEKLKEISTGFNSFRARHSAFLKTIRNYVSAHREKDALAQLDVMAGVNPLEVYRLGAEFSDPLRTFFAFQTALMNYAKHPGVILQEALRLADRP